MLSAPAKPPKEILPSMFHVILLLIKSVCGSGQLTHFPNLPDILQELKRPYLKAETVHSNHLRPFPQKPCSNCSVRKPPHTKQVKIANPLSPAVQDTPAFAEFWIYEKRGPLRCARSKFDLSGQETTSTIISFLHLPRITLSRMQTPRGARGHELRPAAPMLILAQDLPHRIP